MTKDVLEMAGCLLVRRAERVHSCSRKSHRGAMIVCALLLAAFALAACNSPSTSSTTSNACDLSGVSSSSASGIGVSKAVNGDEYIGISDGSFAFDTVSDQIRVDGDVKCQAASQFRAGNMKAATSLWMTAHQRDSNDAEPLIYQQDQQIAQSHSPHVTYVEATILTGTFASLGRSDLQGAYIAQEEHNQSATGLKVRLLIANLGSDPDLNDVTKVVNQIVQAAHADKTIVGVMGFPLSGYVSKDVMKILQDAHLPLVSSGASSDALSNVSPYFFRVVPPDAFQASVAARYAAQSLHAYSVALFFDPNDASSSGLAKDVEQSFTRRGIKVVPEQYSVGHPEKLKALLTDAIQHNVQVLYFATYVSDLNVLLINLPPLPSSSKMTIMGGNSFYQVQDYAIWSRPNFTLLRFTAFAYPDEWGIECQRVHRTNCSPLPSFFNGYSSAFCNPKTDSSKCKNHDDYGFTRANSDTIVSYDTLNVLLAGYQLALSQGQKTPLTSSQEQAGLQMITGTHAYSGISGQIAFQKSGDPANKAIVLLYVDTKGFINVVPNVGIQGCFFAGHCNG